MSSKSKSRLLFLRSSKPDVPVIGGYEDYLGTSMLLLYSLLGFDLLLLLPELLRFLILVDETFD